MKKGGSAALAAMLKQKSININTQQNTIASPPRPPNDNAKPSTPPPAAAQPDVPFAASPAAPNPPQDSAPQPVKATTPPKPASVAPPPPTSAPPQRPSAPAPAPPVSAAPAPPSVSAPATANAPKPAPPATSKPPPPTVSKESEPVRSPPKPVTAPVGPTPSYTPTNNATVFSATTPECTSCGKPVYKMEEVVAVGRIWHASCFVCGGTNKKNLGCKRTLKRDGYLDHENNPYCTTCHAKVIAPPTPTNVLPPPRLNSNPTSGTGVVIGARASNTLHKEAAYVGDHDEVDESEWD